MKRSRWSWCRGPDPSLWRGRTARCRAALEDLDDDHAAAATGAGRALGIYEPSEEPSSKGAEERRESLKPDETFGVRLLGRTIPALRTPDGIRAVEKDFRPASAASVERYLASKFGDHLDEVRAAMEQLAASLSPDELNRRGFALYEAFRPAIPAGARGWGAAGGLDLERITGLARGES